MSSGRIQGLDGLRALAVLAVLLVHTRLWPQGGMGVDLFFVLSGFLITGILLDARAAGYAALKPFYVRRALRIFPPAFLLLAIVARRVPLHEQAWYWTYVGNWMRTRGTAIYLNHFWSLGVEEQYYLVWPLLVMTLSRSSLRRLCVTLFVLAFVLRLGVVLSGALFTLDRIATNGTIFRLDGLVVGSLLALAQRDGHLEAFVRRFALAAVVAAPLWLLSLWSYEAHYVVTYSLLAIVFGAVVSRVVARAPAWLTWAPVRYVGQIS